MKESRFPAPAFGGRRLRSTACHQRTAPLVPLAMLDLPNRGRRVAFGSSVHKVEIRQAIFALPSYFYSLQPFTLSGHFHPTSVVRITVEPGRLIRLWAAVDPQLNCLSVLLQ